MNADCKTESRLEKILRSGKFAVTGECGPPRGADPEVIRKKCGLLKNNADAFNITDNQTSVVRMSSIASSIVMMQEGLEPVMQMVCRDRNRIAIQSDILGGAGSRHQEHALPVRRPSEVWGSSSGQERL